LSDVDLLKDLYYVVSEILLALVPLTVVFIVFQLAILKLPRRYFLDTLKGLALAAVGLVFFLYGVIIGFLPAGWEIGSLLAGKGLAWVLIPAGFALGLVATIAEPAVRVLGSQVEEQSGGYVREKMILACISLGVASVVSLAMARVVFGIPLHLLLIPGYALAFLLMFVFKPAFAPLAFDAGGVATGPMTVTFIVAIAAGAADSLGGEAGVENSFGLVALVALAPIIAIMILDLVYRRKRGSHE